MWDSNAFIKYLEGEGLSKNTVISYSNDFCTYSNWFQETYGMDFDGKVIDNDLDMYKSYLLNIKNFKPSTINRKLMAIKKFGLSMGKEIEVKKQLVRLVDPSDKKIETIDKKVANKLRRAFHIGENKRDIAIFELLYNCGLRVSELCSLQFRDVVLTERNGSSNYSYIIVRESKGKSYREVPLNSRSKKAISEYIDSRKESEGRIFTGQRGPIRRETINKVLEKYCGKAQIEKIGCHTLRHTFCTELINNNTPVSTVSRLAGHSNVLTTMQFYINTSRKDKELAVKGLEL